VGYIPNRQDMEYALNELNSAGFPMEQILVAKDAEKMISWAGLGLVIVLRTEAPQCAIAGSMLDADGYCGSWYFSSARSVL